MTDNTLSNGMELQVQIEPTAADVSELAAALHRKTSELERNNIEKIDAIYKVLVHCTTAAAAATTVCASLVTFLVNSFHARCALFTLAEGIYIPQPAAMEAEEEKEELLRTELGALKSIKALRERAAMAGIDVEAVQGVAKGGGGAKRKKQALIERIIAAEAASTATATEAGRGFYSQ